jgi:hypothetical protein
MPRSHETLIGSNTTITIMPHAGIATSVPNLAKAGFIGNVSSGLRFLHAVFDCESVELC